MASVEKIIEKISSRPFNTSITFTELTDYLTHYGFSLERINSSHYIFKHNNGSMLSVPCHGKTVKAAYVKQAYKLVKNLEDENEKGD